MLFVVLKLMLSFLLVPFFVVMMMTPLLAREPYMAVEDASLSTVMLSISAGFIKLRKLLALPDMPPCSKGTPSRTISGSLLALREAPPRTRIVLPAVAEPLLLMICTPAIFPLISCSGELICPTLKSLDDTVDTEPVRSLRRVVP